MTSKIKTAKIMAAQKFLEDRYKAELLKLQSADHRIKLVWEEEAKQAESDAHFLMNQATTGIDFKE